MYISYKSNIIQKIHETEWNCRRHTKEMSKPEYWEWIATITTQDENDNDVITYPSEDFTIVECTDENVQERFAQLDDYISTTPQTGTVYNIKWSDKKTKVTVNDVEIETHFTGDDSAKDARILAEKWKNVRSQRNRKLAKTDYLALSDNTLSSDMETYRQELRDVPTQSDPDKITWPTKPA